MKNNKIFQSARKFATIAFLPITISVAFAPQAAWGEQNLAQQAQHRSGPGDYHNIAAACDTDYRKFCPNRVENPDGREVGFCLKFRKSDLSLGCRHAIENSEKQPTLKHKARRSKKAPIAQ